MKIGILLVEDNDAQRTVLAFRIKRELRDIQLDQAKYVVDAEAMIKSATSRGVRYVAVVLDIELPESEGKPAEYQFGLRDLVLQSTSRDAFVFYVSSHMEDPEIQKFRDQLLRMLDVNKELKFPRPDFIAKTLGDWNGEVCTKLRMAIVSRQIRAMIDEVWPVVLGRGGPPQATISSPSLRWPPESEAFASSDPTHTLAELEGHIEQNWRYLDVPTRDEVKSRFVVRTGDNDDVEVSLI